VEQLKLLKKNTKRKRLKEIS